MTMMALLLDLKQQMGDMQEEIKTIKEKRQTEEAESDSSEVNDTAEGAVGGQVEEEGAEATPVSLRKDLKLMRQAAAKLASLQVEDSDGDDMDDLPKSRSNGKKSGAMMTAVESVKTRID